MIQSDLLGTLSKAKLAPYREEKVTLNHLDRQVLFEWSETGHKHGGFNSDSSALMKGEAWPQEWEKEQSNNNDNAISPKGPEKVNLIQDFINLWFGKCVELGHPNGRQTVPWTRCRCLWASTNLDVHSSKLTWHLKMDGWNTSFLWGWPIFRGYVSFRGVNLFLQAVLGWAF